MFTCDGWSLIADFGFVKYFWCDVLGGSESVFLMRVGEALGTAGYMAPELFDHSEKAGFSTDVFGLGVIFYECFVGRESFAVESTQTILTHTTINNFTPLTKKHTEIPRWLAE